MLSQVFGIFLKIKIVCRKKKHFFQIIFYIFIYLDLAYAIIGLLVLVALIPLCLGIFYRVYCNGNRKSDWTLDHDSHKKSPDNQPDVSIPTYVNHSTQTTDTPIRI
jgi:hypothetical protein